VELTSSVSLSPTPDRPVSPVLGSPDKESRHLFLAPWHLQVIEGVASILADDVIPEGTVCWKSSNTNCFVLSEEQFSILKGSERVISDVSAGFYESISRFGSWTSDELGATRVVVRLDGSQYTIASAKPNLQLITEGHGADLSFKLVALRNISAGETLSEDWDSFHRRVEAAPLLDPLAGVCLAGPSKFGVGLYTCKSFVAGEKWWEADGKKNAISLSVAHVRTLRASHMCDVMRKLDETLRTYTFGDQISKEFFLILDNGRFVNHDADHPNSGADHPVTGKPFHSKGYTSASGFIVDVPIGTEIFENYATFEEDTEIAPDPFPVDYASKKILESSAAGHV